MPGFADHHVWVKRRQAHVRAPLPRLQVGDRVWHYTEAHGLLGIVQGRSLWATAPVGLNDESEVAYGQRLVQHIWSSEHGTYAYTSSEERHVDAVVREALRADLRGRVYFVSASLDGDSVNQWQHYARRGGFAVEINAGATLVPDIDTPSRWDLDVTWARVVYNDEEQRRAIKEVFDFLALLAPEESEEEADEHRVQGHAFYLTTLICVLKHSSFQGEREVRMVASVPEGQDVELYRVRGTTLVPYLPIVAARREDGPIVADQHLGLAIEGVRLGPGATDVDEYIVGRLLRRNGYHLAAVSRSAVPLR